MVSSLRFPEPIAIIGSGCRFPGGCDTPSKLWELLRNPRDLLKEIPENRFSADSFYHPDNAHHGTSNVRHSYLLEEDLRRFDAQFFGISPIEANAVDPQQRLLLETVYESLESAGLSIQQLQGSDTAVYVGVMSADFTDMIGRDTETFPTYFATGTARSILSNRLSYFFDWHGPSLTIDTACSSSLIAMHQAVQTLRSGDSSLAVVAGSNLILGPEQYIAESKLQMLSPTGRSRMWDAAVDGYARGEGVAAIVLKPLSQAVADGDDIECIIRETGVNQDGKTPGITMPSATAQAALIRSTYAKAGLDLSRRSDRPQYFEAHGTGTPAGDPIEARAISTAFFGSDLSFSPDSRDDTLFVGSIKTVIGHTEGTAGLAAVIKASLALRSGIIPPNRLLEQLNPAIRPFYDNLQILSAAEDWPQLPPGGVRRASVNSFGFGGANSHAILESYEPSISSPGLASDIAFTPFAFSAGSESALLASLRVYRDFLSTRSDIRMIQLSWTLSSRRSIHTSRLAIAASTKDDLVVKLDEIVESYGKSDTSVDLSHRKSHTDELRILGIFTGQGAQWARMGAELIEKSPAASKIIDALERSLQALPQHDRPTWSLRKQILATASSSLVGTASISQPLCTAIQIMLVDMLHEAGIRFTAVVGHSSGEIGAAYAAGCLSAEDAIRVAYYRGLHLKSVTQQGLMLAVGTTFEDAKELCDLPTFSGRVCVAASNSPTSVTLSGDADAIEEIKVVFDEEKKFTRLLKVDRAYHSHHMQVCVEPYVQSLRQCRIQFTLPHKDRCVWISSVFVQDILEVSENVSDRYWASNLASPVRFAEALQLLLARECTFDLAVEVGPHPALNGPASQTIQDALGHSIPYTGVLHRGSNDVEAFSTALGFIWTTFGKAAVDFARFSKFVSESPDQPRVLKGLPTYQWDHSRTFWHESRVSRAFRTRKDIPNELLGRQVMDGAPDQLRWRNILRPKEMAWLDGHQVQGQIVFPCAGYVSACVEASMRLAQAQNVQSIELEDFVVGQAIAFNDNNSEVETLITLTDIVRHEQAIFARFSFYSCPTNTETLELFSHASCRLRVNIGDSITDLLQSQAEADFMLLDVDSDRFYNALAQLGFGYSGPFRVLTGLKRKLGIATGFIENSPPSVNHTQPLLIHPATLDAAIQSIMLAYCYPGDSMLRSIHLPTGIEKLTVNPVNCLKFAGQSVQVPFDSTASSNNSRSLQGDVSIYSLDGSRAIQLEGLQTQPLSSPTEASDLNIFTELVWGVDRPDCDEILRTTKVQDLNSDLLFSLERVAYFYLKHLDENVPARERNGLEWHHKRLFEYVDHVLSNVARGVNRFARPEWAGDSKDVILDIFNRYPDNIDLRLMRAVGENLPAVVRGQLTMLEPMVQDNMLNDFYVVAHGMPCYTKYLAAVASQISHRYPHMNVLEIGAGTGGATKSFLKELGEGFSTYTFTDISSGFFEKASQVFGSYSSKMSFKVLDIEKDTESQGFAPHSFDVVIASLVLHATRDLAHTVRNVRQLLKPGGYLLLLEITENEQMRFGLIFGGLPGWWLGYDDKRPLSPCVGLDKWSEVLRDNGFSGIDSAIPHHDTLPVPLSVVVSQAVDERVQCLQSPLLSNYRTTVISRLTVIGGGGAKSAQLTKAVTQLIRPQCGQIRAVESLHEIRAEDLPVGGSVLCLTDIDEPVFKSMDADKLRGFQEIFKQSKNVLWITQGSRSGDPYARMVVGFARTMVLEMLHLRLQLLDVSPGSIPDPKPIAEAMLRLEVTGTWEDAGTDDGPILYSVEPELSLEDGKYSVPRFKLNEEQNTRYNSSRRSIQYEQSIRDTPVKLVYRDNTVCLLELPESSTNAILEPSIKCVEFDVTYSINKAVEVLPGCYLFSIVGKDRDTGEQFIALSPDQSSRVRLPRSLLMPQANSADEEKTLQVFYNELLAHSIMRDVPYDSDVVVLDPSLALADGLENVAREKGVNLALWTTNAGRTMSHWTYLHPKASRTEIGKILSSKVTCFLNMGTNDSLSARVIACLPHFTQVKSEGSLTTLTGHLTPNVLSDVRLLLSDIGHALRTRRHFRSLDLSTVSLKEIVARPSVSDTCLIKWADDSLVAPVTVEPIETKVHFRSDRTYWLVGLTGGLGLSLCEWMAQQGARYIVLSSRSPKVDGRWVNKMKAMGVTVEVMANDISQRDSVQSVYRRVCQELPPIAGVAQGAMVLHDTMFLDLDMERMNKVLLPKVKGSTYLEEIFRDTELEFFVFFSSMAAVTGNPGQSAYAAANMFMASLANQRRQRGLNASAVHIGAIFGNGYVTRELTLAQQEFLRKVGNLWLSEHDFRRLFAEALYAGRHHRGRSHELSTGLKIIDSDESQAITWFNNPMFQHCIKKTGRTELVAEGSTSGAPVKVRLLEAVSPADVYDIISDAFVMKLKTNLQGEDDRPIAGLTADTLGIDSLVAVDIRSWFIKELHVEIPVLKILSGATVGEILVQAQELLPKELTPKLDPNATSKPSKPKQTVQRPQHSKQSIMAQNDFGNSASVPSQQLSVAEANASTLGHSTHSRHEIDPPTATPSPDATKTVSSVIVENVSENSDSSLQASATIDLSPDSKHRLDQEVLISSMSSSSWSEIDESEGKTELSSSKSSTTTSHIIPKTIAVEPKKSVPISFAQSRFWFLRHYLKDPSTFNITVSIRLDGPLRVDDFARAVQVIGQRHEALRTRFVTDDTQGTTKQEVLVASSLILEQRAISGDDEADEIYQEIKGYVFKVEEGENMRILLLQKSSVSFQLIIAYHHINMDGASLEVLLGDLQMAYESKFLSPRILQYADFSEQQRREYQAGEWADDLAFWKREFEVIPSPLPLLPMARTSARATLKTYETHTTEYRIDSALLESIQATCDRMKVTAFHFHLAVFYTMLIRLVDAEHLSIGISSANRYRKDMLQSVGLYLNLLPLHFTPQMDHTFTNILHIVREKSLNAFAHSKVPFDVIVNELGVPRSASHSPLFQVLVNYRAGVSESRTFCSCDSTATAFEQGQAPYDVSLDIIDNPDGECHVIIAGQSVLYDAQHVDVLGRVYRNLLTVFARNPALRLDVPALYEAKEVKRSIKLGHGSVYKYKWPETIPERIDIMVQRYGTHVALIDGNGRKTTYTQMDQRVNSLAMALLERGAGHGSRIGVFMEPRSDWICSLLAILRLDAIYIPLDSRMGLDRLTTVAQDCKPDLVLVDNISAPDFASLKTSGSSVNVDQIFSRSNESKVPNAARPSSTAVIMYTSGSTGVPKGIVMQHQTFRNNIETSTDKWDFREGSDIALQQSSYSFDMSLSQTFLALSNGGTLRIVPKQLRGDPQAISSLIATEGITFTEATPSEYISWLRYGDTDGLRHSSWRIVVSGGEPVTDTLTLGFRQLEKSDLELIDCYGPTEITFCSHSRTVSYDGDDNTTSPGFQTWPNYSVYIVDRYMKPVPAGIPGQVILGGAGVVAGYLHSELDTSGFARNQFMSAEFLENGWTRMHRTGDSGRLTHDGKLILGGRIAGDTQVKLRGIRIELQEVESAIVNSANGKIVDAVVLVRKSAATGSEALIAYVTLRGADEGDKDKEPLEQIRQQLPLPQYMRPAVIIPLDRMPITSSNKIDRLALKSLPLPPVLQTGETELHTDESPSIAKMREVWANVIPKEILAHFQLRPSSDYFHVGGDSMLLVRLQSEINKVFNTTISLFQLFDASTLEGMASLVADSGSTQEKVAVDWESETAVSPNLLQVPATKRFSAHPAVVVLTGATGFLGRAILNRLLKDCSVQKIHCLAVRRDPSSLPEEFQSPKVIIHRGDLTLPQFGLTDRRVADIFAESDAVIHNGADVSFLKSYQSLKPANVEATKELVRLSIPYRLSFHYISTASVTHLTGQENFDQSSVSGFVPSLDDGYVASKWASERYLEKVSHQCGLPIWIHRPSSITGDGAPETDMMANLLRYSRALRAIPQTEGWTGWLDFVSADRVAMRIADEVYEDYSWPGTVKYLYESGDREIPLSDLKGVLEREKGETFEVVPLSEWVSRAEEQGLHPLLGEYLQNISGMPLLLPRLVQQGDVF
ncbi:hypothetical protein CNMCM5623_002479 [Aspergillus felis]|uniref:Uncharacterized protein n=1 Tax=Aspergillus felis TaxID=1287682 RepID=A0A8H6QBK3_9EURO|nr:hypothetical protein CNMCM5623_002479 [Aspergillus felis]